MIVEQVIFTIIAFALFVLIFLKMIQKNDTSYIPILVLEAIGIALKFIEILFSFHLHIIFNALSYMCSIILPIFIVILEKQRINFMEILNVTKAKVYFVLKNNKKAKKLLIDLVTKYPNSYYGHKILAEIYEQEGGMRKAIDEYVQAIDINKKDYDSYYKVADLLNQLNKPDEASQMLTNLLNKRPDYIKASELLGEILISQENYKEAVNIYIEALKYNPTSYELNYCLGLTYTMLNDFQSAKECYEKAAELNSLVYNTKYSLAEIALIYKELEEAEKYFLEVVEDEELEADAYFELAKISIIKKEKDRAINYANIAIESDPKKIIPKIKNDSLFIPIMAKIAIPFNLPEEKEDKKTKLTKKEIKAKEHLEEMFDITRQLSYDDIRLLKKNKMKEDIDVNTFNFDQYQKEREE